MQRLAEKIYREFSPSCKFVEVLVLDGNGDNFQVYQGHISDVSAHNFSHILRDPGCFYFFQVTSLSELTSSTQGPESTIVRRDLCWLTDPSPPVAEFVGSTEITVSWEAARFCGIQPPDKVDSIQYCIDISEGIEWKESAMSKYITDALVAPSSYSTIFRSGEDTCYTIQNLKPANWYHIRVSIEYLGVRVTSEALNVATGRAPPGIPTSPRCTLIPIRNSFDLKSNIPARYELLITWNTVNPNGSPIDRYQVQLQRLDAFRQVINEEPPVTTMTRPSTSATSSNGETGRGKHVQAFMNEAKAISILTTPSNRNSNQWIGSPGRSEVQIRNSLQSRGRVPNTTSTQNINNNNSSMSNRRSLSPPSSSPAMGQRGLSHSNQQQGNSLESFPATAGIWRIIYDNLNRNVRLSAPMPTDAIWLLRVRAHNKEGWSGFSRVLELSWKNFPSLFVCRPVQSVNQSDSVGPVESNHKQSSGNNNNNNSNNNEAVASFSLDSERSPTARTDDSFASRRSGPSHSNSFRDVNNNNNTANNMNHVNNNSSNNNNNNNTSSFVLPSLQVTIDGAGSRSLPHSHQNTPLYTAPLGSSRLDDNAPLRSNTGAVTPAASTAAGVVGAEKQNSNNAPSHGLPLFLPHISTEYELLAEKNASSTSLMLEHASPHHSTSNAPTPTMLALQQHRIQHLQEHILNHQPSPTASSHLHGYGQVVGLPHLHK